MKIAYVIPGNVGFAGARYKYFNLLKSIDEINIQLFLESHLQPAILWKPDIFMIFGDKYPTYKAMIQNHCEYILCEHDVVSLRHELDPISIRQERTKINSSRKIIFTSPLHQKYICEKYDYHFSRTMVLILRPKRDDLNFEPMEKLPGKNIVYAGGLQDNSNKTGKFGYRCYRGIFENFIANGWNVHVYPIREYPRDLSQIGCIKHETVPEGKELYRELSQYTCGLQAYNKDGVHDRSYEYSQQCFPNKAFLYLASGIPTVGINPGISGEYYNKKWGIVLKNYSEISTIPMRISNLELEKYRYEEVIENQTEEIKKFLKI